MTEFAIVGLGSWGLCVLERTVSRARRTTDPIRLHVVEPGPARWRHLHDGATRLPGAQQPVRPAVAVRVARRRRGSPVRHGLYEWAVEKGYRWVGYECRIGTEGTPILSTDFLPRRLMGEYLAWFYDTLLADAPPNLEIVRHYAPPPTSRRRSAVARRVLLDNGTTISVDHVVLTSGHTWNEELVGDSPDVRYLRPYPVEYFDIPMPPGAPIAIAGMGLVGFDLLTALTVGRGGPTRTWVIASATYRAAANRRSTCTRVRGFPTAPSRRTASTPTVTTSPWCARPRHSANSPIRGLAPAAPG
jgi:hypothetical protein